MNATDCDLWTPLHLAVFHGWPTTAQVLLRAHANPAAKTKKGSTALIAAALGKKPGMCIEALMASPGSDLWATNHQG